MSEIRKYKDAKDFLFKQLPMFQREGAKAFKTDLKNIEHLVEKLNQPQDKFKSIHIAGTNGKGSTAHFLASILMTHGLKVGIYTSPHYQDYRERIKINGKKVPKDYVVDFLNNLIDNGVFEEQFKPSFFEISVGLAFQYFAESDIDVAIIETGLGGRLDSTNVITPQISVITNIGLDHTAFLGETKEKIAKEKAGIIKPEIPVYIGEKQEETKAVFKEKANESNSPLIFVEDVLKIELIAKAILGNSYKINVEGEEYVFKTSITGPFQIKNIATAVKVARSFLKQRKVKLDGEKLALALSQNLEKIGYVGRYQWISYTPLTLVDSAHNEAALKILFEEVASIHTNNLHVIYGAVKDKSLDGMLDLLPKDARYYFCKADIPRGKDAKELLEEAQEKDLKGGAYKSVKKALKAAQKEANPNDLILITGSIFVVAEVL